MGVELILRPDLGVKPYWLHARFGMPAYPKVKWLDDAADYWGKLFIADMNKQGWQFQDKHGLWYCGPLQSTPITGAPSRLERVRFRAADGPTAARALQESGGYTASMPLLDQSETWEYDLKGVFVHDTILTERPDPHEEDAMWRNR